MKLDLQINPHTIIMMVGPSCCGKSYLASKINEQIPSTIISSDELRRRLLMSDTHKHDSRMMQVSKQAFNLLFAELNEYTSYPVNQPVIIIDSTGLDEVFRDKIRQVASNNHYHVVCIAFAYANRDDYYKFVSDDDRTFIINKHVDRMNKRVVNSLKKGDYQQLIRLRKPVTELNISIHSEARYLELDTDDFIVVGDIHGCWKELDQIPKDRTVVLVGDIIDKNSNEHSIQAVSNVLELMKLPNFYVVRGNHEHFAVNRWGGKSNITLDQSIIDEHFSASNIEDESFRNAVREIYNQAYDWVVSPNYIVTHSPCKRAFLGKHSSVGRRMMRNLRHAGKDVPTLLEFLHIEDNGCYPTHIFGHIAFDKPYHGKSWQSVDTGCVYGGGLTYFDCVTQRCTTIPSRIYINKENALSKLRDNSKPRFTMKDVYDKYDRGRIFSIIENKIGFISGTMSPADKLGNDLESLEWALNYYRERGIHHVVIQPKMMGSRAQLYLYNDLSKCRFVSRNGFVVKSNEYDLEPLYKEWRNKLGIITDSQYCIIDGELMPWRVLGSLLIEYTFQDYICQVRNELSHLEKCGFYQTFNGIQLNPEYFSLNKKEFIEKYKHHVYKLHEGYLSMRNSVFNPTDIRTDIMQRQMDIHGEDSKPWFYGFAVLKDQDRIWGYGESNHAMFEHLNGYSYLTPTDDLDNATKIFNKIVGPTDTEGVVMKPEIITKDIAPYLKVRNKDYLTIVYGPDYQCQTKYEKLLNRKRIDRKLRQSIKEFDLGLKMLEYDDFDDPQYQSLVIQKVIGESQERTMDPRL